MSIVNADFNNLVKKILIERGFDCRQYRESYLQRRFGVRMRACRVLQYSDYAGYLDHHPEEYNKLFDNITINVTQFFRDLSVYTFFQEKAIPALFEEKKRTHNPLVRVWSCGCSSGEEPYSIAICLMNYLRTVREKYTISIFGTDIDDASLNKARIGLYARSSLENVSSGLLEKYFTVENDKYKVREEARLLTKFMKHDFIREEPLRNLDIIFCRNVMIYLTREMQTRLLVSFYKSINQKGFLVLGKVESLLSVNEGLFERFNVTERIYQKT